MEVGNLVGVRCVFGVRSIRLVDKFGYVGMCGVCGDSNLGPK